MGVNRRKFFKVTGLATLAGLAGNQSVEALKASRQKFLHDDEALHGERWAMTIDLTKCKSDEGCTDCSKVCHSAHNVPDIKDEPKHEIKWIWQESFESAFPSQGNEFINEAIEHHPIPILCNHCDNPPCTRVCPTQATWKQDNGIVMMDWHRCIGCRYCIAACPYGSRSFNWVDPRGEDEEGHSLIEKQDPDFPTRSKGVVEKCTFCNERLEKGQKPLCVEKCPHGAMAFGDLGDPDSDVRKLLHEKYSIRRKPGLGTQPEVYYLV